MPVKALRVGDVLDMGEGRRAVIIGRAGRLPSNPSRDRWAPLALGTPGFRHALTAYGWHVQYLDTGELETLGEQTPNRLGERPHPVMGAYADTCDADMLL